MFVQVGKKAFNLDRVLVIYFDTPGSSPGPEIQIVFGTPDSEGTKILILQGDEAESFKHWWEERTDVYRAV
jgi:hypothetical protein